jgi:hypothetical protein
MSLTRFWGLLVLLLVACLPARAELGDRVIWTDARTHDGRVVRAAELKGRTVVVE